MKKRFYNPLKFPFTPTEIPGLQAWYSSRYFTSLISDGAASFASASNQVLSVADNATIQGGNLDLGTAGWVYLETIAAETDAIFIKGNAAGDTTLDYVLSKTATNYIQWGYSYYGGGYAGLLPWSSTVSAGQWYFIMGYHDATAQKVYLSVSGAAFLEAANTKIPQVATGKNLGLGDYSAGAQRPLNGRMDNWLLIKSPPGGIAGVAATIRDALYNSGSGLPFENITPAQRTAWGIVSGWKLNEATGTRYDYFGSNNLTASASSPTLAAGIVSGYASQTGDPISQWSDLSGNGRHITQATASARPTLALGSQNGLPGITSDGVDDYLINDTVAALLSGTGKLLTIISVAKATVDGGVTFGFGRSSSATPFFSHYPRASGEARSTIRNDAAGEDDQLLGATASGECSIVSSVISAASISSRKNGGTASVAAIGGAITLDRFTVEALRRNTTLGYLTGSTYELLIYNVVLTDAQIQYLTRGLGAVWGINVP